MEEKEVQEKLDQLKKIRDQVTGIAKAAGWNDDKIASTLGNTGQRIKSLEGTIENLERLEGSTQVYQRRLHYPINITAVDTIANFYECNSTSWRN